MVADGQAVEAQALFALADADDGEVGRAAADVADEDELPVLHGRLPVVFVVGEPGIEGGQRLFEQDGARHARLLRRRNRQLAGDFVEGGRDGEDDELFVEAVALAAFRHLRIPGFADVLQIAPARLDGRDPVDLVGGAPGQDAGGAVDAGVAEPRLGRGHQPPRHDGSLLARKLADDVRALGVPRQRGAAGGQVVSAGEIEERRQHRPPRHLGLRDELGNLKKLDRPARRGIRLLHQIDVSHRLVGGAQVDADDVSVVNHF